jgi:type I restriction enzyme S subunit
MFDLSNWPKKPVSDLFYVKGRIGWRGLKRKDFCSEGPYLITGMHIDDDGSVNWNSCFRIPVHKYEESPEIKIAVDDLVITKDGTIGKVAYIDYLPGQTSLNSHLFLVRAKDSSLLIPKFAYHIFRSRAFEEFIELHKSGSTLAGLGEGKFLKFQFPLPNIEEQRKFTALVNSIETTISQTEAIIAKLQQVKLGLLHDLLTRGVDANGELRPPMEVAPHLYKESPLGWIPKEWEIGPFREMCISSAFGPRFPSDAYDENGPLATLRTTDMDDEGNITLGTMPRAAIAPSSMANHLLLPGDLVISRSGTCGVTGVFGGHDLPVVPGAFLIRFRLNEVKVNQFYRRYFNSTQGRPRLEQLAVGGVQKNIKGSDVLKLPVPVLACDEAVAISSRIEAVEGDIRSNNFFLSKLKQQKSGLMDDLLTGRVRVTNLLNTYHQSL